MVEINEIKVLIIDNYDSFVYNLYHYVGELKAKPIVKRNNISLKEVRKINPDRIIISPGPGTPKSAGNCIDIIREFTHVPILGVCLGHQCIAEAFGARVSRIKVKHGKTSKIKHDGKNIYEGIENPFIATRYHSLAVEKESLPESLKATAFSLDDGVLMGIRHRKYSIEGVQFHPESILTQKGKKILNNFLGD